MVKVGKWLGECSVNWEFEFKWLEVVCWRSGRSFVDFSEDF
jgi:hypothetical protein